MWRVISAACVATRVWWHLPLLPHCLEAAAASVATLFGGGCCLGCHTVWMRLLPRLPNCLLHLPLLLHCWRRLLLLPHCSLHLPLLSHEFGGICLCCYTVWRHLSVLLHCLEAPVCVATLFGGTCLCFHTVWKHLRLLVTVIQLHKKTQICYDFTPLTEIMMVSSCYWCLIMPINVGVLWTSKII